MIFIGNYPCSVNPKHVADLAVIGKSDVAKEGYDIFRRAYCLDCAKNAITRDGESWAPMEDIYVEFAKRGKTPHPGTTWNREVPPST